MSSMAQMRKASGVTGAGLMAHSMTMPVASPDCLHGADALEPSPNGCWAGLQFNYAAAKHKPLLVRADLDTYVVTEPFVQGYLLGQPRNEGELFYLNGDAQHTYAALSAQTSASNSMPPPIRSGKLLRSLKSAPLLSVATP
ncbi:MAG: hypothetical protein AAFX99_12750 [Myxococcota bacterium]